MSLPCLPRHRPGPPRAGRRLALAALGAGWLAVTAARASQALPEVALQASDGHRVLVGGGPWRATYVDFWASWCAPCRWSFPWMNDMHERYGPRGLRIVAVNLDRREADAQRFLQQIPARFAIAFDPAADSARALDVKTLPCAYLVGPARELLHLHRGFRLEDRDGLEQRLRAALG